jgi:oligopeptide transport system permease protein
MLRFILRRILQALLVLAVVFTVTFFLIRLKPGDPFMGEKAMPESVKKQMLSRYGMDQPILKQYFLHAASFARGDLLPSMRYEGMQNSKIIRDSFPVSLLIGLSALTVALGIGLPAGIIAAVRKNTWLDYSAMSFAMLGICLPTFVMGPILQWIFALNLGWLNVAGWFERTDWILPSATMGLIYGAYIARLTRGGMLEVLNQDYIRTARAKGVPGSQIVIKHALRGGLLPVVAFLGPAFAGITTGSFIIEKIFQLPGLGQHFVGSVFNSDYTLVQATTVFYAALLVFINLGTDILQAWLNPRVRLT